MSSALYPERPDEIVRSLSGFDKTSWALVAGRRRLHRVSYRTKIVFFAQDECRRPFSVPSILCAPPLCCLRSCHIRSGGISPLLDGPFPLCWTGFLVVGDSSWYLIEILSSQLMGTVLRPISVRSTRAVNRPSPTVNRCLYTLLDSVGLRARLKCVSRRKCPDDVHTLCVFRYVSPSRTNNGIHNYVLAQIAGVYVS